MNNTKSWYLIEFALKTLGCNQKELASKLGVSQAQVSMWKKGEAISGSSMENICSLLNISEMAARNLDAVESVHGAKNYDIWISYISFVIEREIQASQLPIDVMDAHSMSEEMDYIAASALHAAVECKIPFPEILPEIVTQLSELDLESIDFDNLETMEEMAKKDAYYNLFSGFSFALEAYLGVLLSLEDDADDESFPELTERFTEIEYSMVRYASYYAIKSMKEEYLFDYIKNAARINFENAGIELRDNINKLIKVMHQNRLPVTIDLALVLESEPNDIIEHLNDLDEQRSFGMGEVQIHPDIYMNELLVNSRKQTAMLEEIHQALVLNNVGDKHITNLVGQHLTK